MTRTKKLLYFALSAVIALTVIFIVSKYFENKKYRSQIPAVPDINSLSEPIKEQLTQAYQTALDEPNADHIGSLGMAFHSSAYYDQAKRCYQLAIQKDPSNWVWSYYQGYLGQEMGDSKAVIANFETVSRENQDISQVWYYLGIAYQNLGSPEKAEEAFLKIAFLETTNTDPGVVRQTYSTFPVAAKFELSRMYLNLGKLDQAEKILAEIIKTDHSNGPIYRLIGNVYRAKGDSVLSKKYLARALDLSEVTSLNDTLIDRIALISRSELYLPKQIDDAVKSANPEWAQKLLNQAIHYLPDNKYLISKAIKFFLNMNSGELSFPYLNRFYNSFEDNYKEIKNIADLLSNKGFYKESIPFYIQARKLKPESTEITENFALSYWRTGQKDSALNMIGNLLDKNRNNPEILTSAIDFMLRTENKDQAKLYLNRFRQLAPLNPQILKMSGQLADLEGNRENAISFYQASFKGDPTDLTTAQKLGAYYIELRMWEQAIDVLKNSLEYHPNESDLLEKLGSLLISCPDPNLQNISEGLELSERAFFHFTSTMTTLIAAGKDLALGYTMQGDFEKASYYIRITKNLAQKEQVSKSFMDGLLKLESYIQTAQKK